MDWRDGLWYKMWEMGIKGKLWRVVMSLYANIRSCVFLEGKSSEFFLEDLPWRPALFQKTCPYQGVAQGCTLSPTLFLIYINGLSNEIEKYPELGVKFSKNKMSGLLFVDDFEGIAETGTALQSVIDSVYTTCNYSKCWRFEANVKRMCYCNIFKNRKGFWQVGLG